MLAPTVVLSDSAATRESTSTLDNLQTAFNGESNANAGYVAFAVLLRAEEIHARNHGDEIRKMGATPALNLEPIEVKSTQENLQTAIAGEKYERDIMYSEFVEVATHEKATAGIRTFTFALKVEAVHAVLYQDALDNLQKRTGKNHTYYVCPDCGNTLEEPNIAKCLVCGYSKSGLIAVGELGDVGESRRSATVDLQAGYCV